MYMTTFLLIVILYYSTFFIKTVQFIVQFHQYMFFLTRETFININLYQSCKNLNGILSKHCEKKDRVCSYQCIDHVHIIFHWFTWFFHHYYLIYDSTCNSHSTSYTWKRGWALFAVSDDLFTIVTWFPSGYVTSRLYIASVQRWLSNLSPYLVTLRIKCWFVQVVSSSCIRKKI